MRRYTHASDPNEFGPPIENGEATEDALGSGNAGAGDPGAPPGPAASESAEPSLAAMPPAPPAEASASTSADTVPGGRKNFVVSAAKLTSTTNTDWVKTGSYVFVPDGTVTASMWSWSQSRPVARETTSVRSLAANCGAVPKCGIDIPGGFDDAPNDVRRGSFKILTSEGKDFVRIRWNSAWSEDWWIERAPTYARLRFASGTNQNRGFAYGSHRPLAERDPLATVRGENGLTYEYTARYYDAKIARPKIVGGSAAFSWTVYNTCSDISYEMTFAQKASAQRCASGSSNTSINNYVYRVNSGDRRDAWWQWHGCLADPKGGWDTCYGCNTASGRRVHGGSHVKALMQALDDNGAYLGHVGVEASFTEGTCSKPGGSRSGDMLGILRFGPERGYVGPTNPL